MLYKFKSKAAGDVIMTGPAGDRIVELIGKDAGPKGIILPADMPGAIAALEKAIADEEAERKRAEEEARAEGRTLTVSESISLRQRAWPLVEMMRRAHAADKEIVWGV